MNRLEEIKLNSLQDSWVIMYTFIAKELLSQGGFQGEVALREAIRRYGRDRGLSNQKRLLDNNIKINLAIFNNCKFPFNITSNRTYIFYSCKSIIQNQITFKI